MAGPSRHNPYSVEVSPGAGRVFWDERKDRYVSIRDQRDDTGELTIALQYYGRRREETEGVVQIREEEVEGLMAAVENMERIYKEQAGVYNEEANAAADQLQAEQEFQTLYRRVVHVRLRRRKIRIQLREMVRPGLDLITEMDMPVGFGRALIYGMQVLHGLEQQRN